MFQLMGGGDKAGSGMDKIRAGWRAWRWRSPRLEETLQPDRVKLVLPMVTLIHSHLLLFREPLRFPVVCCVQMNDWWVKVAFQPLNKKTGRDRIRGLSSRKRCWASLAKNTQNRY